MIASADSFDPRTEANIATLHPRAQAAARAFIARALELLAPKGYTVKIIAGTRTWEEQDALYEIGRTRPGRIVTRARGGFSNHNFGIAADIGIFDLRGLYIDDLEEQKALPRQTVTNLYRSLGPVAVAMGGTWGGTWKGFVDEPHYELHPEWARDMSESEMLAELRRRHVNGKDIFE